MFWNMTAVWMDKAAVEPGKRQPFGPLKTAVGNSYAEEGRDEYESAVNGRDL